MTSQLRTAWPCECWLLVGVSSRGSQATPGSHYLLLVVHAANTSTPSVCIPRGTISSAWKSLSRWIRPVHLFFPPGATLRTSLPIRCLYIALFFFRNIGECFKISVHALKWCTKWWCQFTGFFYISYATKWNRMLFWTSTNWIPNLILWSRSTWIILHSAH